MNIGYIYICMLYIYYIFLCKRWQKTIIYIYICKSNLGVNIWITRDLVSEINILWKSKFTINTYLAFVRISYICLRIWSPSEWVLFWPFYLYCFSAIGVAHWKNKYISWLSSVRVTFTFYNKTRIRIRCYKIHESEIQFTLTL